MNTLSRRAWLARGAAAALAACKAGTAFAATAETREWPVAGFDALHWRAVGELHIEQTGRERLVVEAEREVLAKIVAEVRGRTLDVGFMPGPVRARQPIVFRLEVRQLDALDLDGAGQGFAGALSARALSLRLQGSMSLEVKSLQADSLDARLEGSGALRIDGGAVGREHIVISGSANVEAAALASREASVVIEGSGNALVHAADQLDARIDGSGDVAYRGQPRVRQRIAGAGRVHRDGE